MGEKLANLQYVDRDSKTGVIMLPQSAFSSHFKYFQKEAMEISVNPIFKENPNSSFIFQIDGVYTYHVIFAFKNSKAIDKSQSVVDYEKDITTVVPINSNKNKLLESKAKILSQTMIESFRDALEFYPWRTVRLPNGFIVDGHTENNDFTMETGGCLGVKVSVDVAEYVDEIYKQKSNLSKRDASLFVTSAFVHEFIHYDKADQVSTKSEAASYFGELVYSMINIGQIPSLTAKDLHETYSKLENIIRLYPEADSMRYLKELDIHSKGEYIATVMVASILANNHREIREILSCDNNELKLNLLRKIYVDKLFLVNEADKIDLFKSMENFMEAKDIEKQISIEFQTAAKKIGINYMESFLLEKDRYLYGAKKRG